MTARRRTLLVLGARLARRGPAPLLALGISAITAIGAAAAGFVLARRGDGEVAAAVPGLAASALAWGGGALLAFGASAGALRRDRVEGIHALFAARTTSLRGYLFGRTAGLALVLTVTVGVGALLAGLLVLAGTAHGGGRALQATLAATVYAAAYGAVLAPVALAAVGARARTAAFGLFAVVLVVPELLVRPLHDVAPAWLAELCSLPSALAVLRGALAPGSVDLLRGGRALVALLAMATAALLVLRRDLARLEREGEP